MRAMVTKGGIYTWINTRENKFIEENFTEADAIRGEELNERERYIAQELVGRGVLDKTVEGKTVQYKLNRNKMVK